MSVLRLLSAAALAASALPAQIVVSTLSDGAPGSLRSAIQSVINGGGSQFTIRLDVAGTCTLSSALGALPYLPAGKSVTIVAGFGSGRFVIDAGPVSGTPIFGLRIGGAGSVLAAPLTVQLRQGAGVEVAPGAHDVRIDDLQVMGGSTGLQGMSVSRLRVRGAWVAGAGIGIRLENCIDARLGDAAGGAQIAATGCGGQGLLIQYGSGNVVELFTAADSRDSSGVLAMNTANLVLGTPGGPRSAVRNNARDGVRLVNVSNGLLQQTDVEMSGTVGLTVDGGSGNQATLVRFDQNRQSAIDISGTASGTIIGPAVTCSNTAAGNGAGIMIGGSSRNTLVADSDIGPGNGPGVYVSSPATGVTIRGGSISANNTGVFLTQIGNSTIEGVRIERNASFGVVVNESTDAVIRGCTINQNYGSGITVQDRSHRAVIGPGNFIEDNSFQGVFVTDSDDCLITGNQSISRNRGAGVDAARSPRVMIERNVVANNLGIGLALTFSCNASRIGPGNIVRDSSGHGIKVELCEAVLLDANQVTGCSGTGVMVIAQPRVGAVGHTLRSMLITRNRDVGVINRDGATVNLIGCTIAANYRGLRTSGQSTTNRTQMLVNSCILWGNQLDDYNNEASPTGLVTPTYCIVQNAPGTGSNHASDPQFVNPASDWRLLPTSPAVDAGDPQAAQAASPEHIDAFGGDRLVNCAMDMGGHELQRLAFVPHSMPPGGGRVYFAAMYPASDAGRWSLLLFSTSTAPRTRSSLFGHCLPLRFDSWTGSALQVPPQLHYNVLTQIPGSGSVNGWLDYTNLVPAGLNVAIYAVGVSLANVGGLRAYTSTNVASFTLQ